MMTISEEDTPNTEPKVNDENEFLLSVYKGMIVTHFIAPQWRTKQQAYRFAAYLKLLSEILPDEEVPSTWDEVLAAIAK